MEREVEESIKKFEHKKEFREVKLKTRESFREDQVALERRLSTHRPRVQRKMSADDQSEGSDDKKQESGSSSILESIVLDISSERENDSVDAVTVIANGEHKPEPNGIKVVETNVNGHSQNRSIPNGGAPRTVYTTTRQNGHIPASMTPGPRLKLSGRRIYEKNPRLTTASTEHLDTISLRGSGKSQGLRLVEVKQQQSYVPIVPSLPISSIPADGNLREFNVDEMVSIFRMLNIDEEMLLRFSANKVDGKRFAMFADKDLEKLGISNPIVRYFRDRTAHRKKKATPAFML